MKTSVLFLTIITLTNCASTHFYDIKNQTDLNLKQFIKNIPNDAIIVLGEEHYNKKIQKAQAHFLKQVIETKELEGQFIFAWEFLNRIDQEKIETAYAHYQGNRLFDIDFMKIIMGEKLASTSLTYMPLFREARNLGGDILALNAPREWKRTITQEGLHKNLETFKENNLKQYHRCSENYYKRFKEAMSQHPTPLEVLDKYYEAQCYTDNYMAESLTLTHSDKLTFVVVGKHHSDYFDGLVRDLKMRLPKRHIRVLSFVDSKNKNPTSIKELKKSHPHYGIIADILVIAQ